MRQRGQNFSKNPSDAGEELATEDKYSSNYSVCYGKKLWLTIFTFYIFLYLTVCMRNTTFPDPKTKQNSLPGDFVEERARKYLKDLTSMGPRTVGSVQNEKLAVDYLTRQLEKIKTNSKPQHDVQIDVQKVSGTFTLGFIGGFNSIYENMNNIIVKLSPRAGSNDSLLVNCHYDSVAESPGNSHSRPMPV